MATTTSPQDANTTLKGSPDIQTPQEKPIPRRKSTRRSTKEPPKETFLSRLSSKLPAWALKIKDKRQQKLFFRCWLGSWIAIILLLPNRNLRVMGNAAFFASIASIMLPLNMPIQSFLLSMTILITACCTGWAWGCGAMRAAYTARDKALYQRTIQQLAATYGPANLTPAFIQSRIFHGDFLDTKSTVVFGVFLGFATFSLGTLRASNAKLALPLVFATIFVDVICSYGPLIPTPQYTILNSFVISTGYYVAIGLVLILLIFPQSLNHEWIGGAIKLLTSVQELIELQDEVLTVDINELSTGPDSLMMRLRGKADAVVADFQALNGKTGMLKLEFSYGRLGPSDLKKLVLPLKNVVVRTRGLMSFVTLLTTHAETRGKDRTPTPPEGSSSEKIETLRVGDTFRLMRVRDVDSKWEDEHRLRAEELLPILESSTARLRQAIIDGVSAASNGLLYVNTERYRTTDKIPAEKRNITGALKELTDAVDEYESTARLTLLDPYNNIFESPFEVDQHGRPPFSLRPLFLCFVFQSNLLWTAGGVKSLLALLDAAKTKRPKSQLWWPRGLSKILDALRPDGKPSPLDEGLPPLVSLSDPAKEGDDFFSNDYQKDPDSLPPASFLQKAGDLLHRFHHWLTTPQAIYGFKYMIITIALWLPQVFKKSAWFTYSERGLWGLIMGQMTLAVYMSDQLAALSGRLIGTVAGGVIGMAAWYVGDGNGPGNPYGLAASAAVFIAPIVFLRLYYPVPMEAIMTGTTTILIIGYSWIDKHLATLGNPGVGWEIAWRRVLLVLIGSGAALILMLLPPQSLRRDVRRSNATNLKDIARLFAVLLSTWLTDLEKGQEPPPGSPDPDVDEDSEDGDDDDSTHAEHKHSMMAYAKWAPAFRKQLFEVASRLQVLQGQTASAKWEGTVRGVWPFEKYNRLVTVQTTMLNNLAQLAGALAQLSPEWRNTLLHRTAFLNPNLITDVMAVFGIVAMSLDTGEAIHEVLPKSLIDRVYYHHSMGPHTFMDQLKSEDASTINGQQHVHVSALTRDTYSSMEFAYYATGCAGAYQILIALDEVQRIVKDLCGEVPLRGFEHWRKEFEMRQLSERV